MKHHMFPLKLCLIAALVFCQEANAQDREAVNEINAGEIAINLSFKPSNPLQLGDPSSGKPLSFFFPMVIIWEDGRVLYGKREVAENRRVTWTHSLGKIDPEKIAPLHKMVSDSFRINRKNVHVLDSGPSGSTVWLRTKLDDGYLIIETWEMFNNANVRTLLPQIAIRGRDRANGMPMLLRDFYDRWREVKKTILEAGEQSVVTDGIPVDVTVDYWVLTVSNKEGEILLRQDLAESFLRNPRPRANVVEKPQDI